MTKPSHRITYELDAQDRIRSTGADWDRFAAANGAPELDSRSILLTPLWHFVTGSEVQHLLRLLFERVRSRNTTVRLPFRCDSPSARRFMELTVRPLPAYALAVESRLLRTESRQYIPLLERSPRLRYGFLTMCSWCKRIRLVNGEWVEVERAIELMDLFAAADLPMLSHRICRSCAALTFGVMQHLEEKR
ncbi:MAG TPA: hypothetical protein VGR27_08445 [Longimicrobiaceae bacterium]|nr:hypothetical protein [Longimicrobiaceae bacterium]